MPRRKSELAPSQRVFKIPDDKTRPLPKTGLRSIPPQNQKAAIIMADDEKRARLASAMSAYCGTLHVMPVKSNAELIQRGEEYFKFCAQRRLVPTVEGLSSYVGYAVRTLLSWQNKERSGFHDGEETTGEIVERLKGVIDAIDGQLAADNDIPFLVWCFRRKALSNWVEAQKIQIETTGGGDTNKPLTAEEIARRLPDPDADYHIETDEYR